MRFMKFFPWVSILSVVLALLAGCANDKAVISQAQQEHQALKPAVMEDPELTGYMQAIGQRIIDAAHELDQQGVGPKTHKSEDTAWMFSKNMQFHLVNSKTLNAFTTGGEHMYIYNALFQQCSSEDELAAVMAHEYGHVYARHVEKGMNRQMVMMGGAALAGGAGYVAGGKEHGAEYAGLGAGAGMLVGQFVGMGYTRKDEAQADALGFNFYTHAGWDPTHFADFFRKMIEMGYDTTPALASDHPTLKSRVEAAQERVNKLPPQAAQWRHPPVADAQHFAELKARAQQDAARMPDDQQAAKAQQLLSAFSSCVAPVETPEQKKAKADLVEEAKKNQKKGGG